MFSYEEKNKIFKIIALYKELHGINSLTETFCIEEDDWLQFDADDFLRFIEDKEYLSKGQIKELGDKLAGYFSDREEVFTDYLQEIDKDKFIFDIWYIDYVSEEGEDSFEHFYDSWKTEILNTEKSEDEIKQTYFDIKENFKDVEKFRNYAYVTSLDFSQISTLNENLEALKEVSTSTLEVEIINNIKIFLKNL